MKEDNVSKPISVHKRHSTFPFVENLQSSATLIPSQPILTRTGQVYRNVVRRSSIETWHYRTFYLHCLENSSHTTKSVRIFLSFAAPPHRKDTVQFKALLTLSSHSFRRIGVSFLGRDYGLLTWQAILLLPLDGRSDPTKLYEQGKKSGTSQIPFSTRVIIKGKHINGDGKICRFKSVILLGDGWRGMHW